MTGPEVALRWLADENFNNDILRALLRRSPDVDVVRAQDAGLTGVDDEALLAWLRHNYGFCLRMTSPP